MSVHRPILRQLLTHPRRTAIVDDTRSYTGLEILAASQHVANAISKTTDRAHVGLLLPTSGVFPIAALAAWTLGRTVVPLNYLLRPDELQYVVDDADIDTIVTVGPMLEHLESTAGTTPAIANTIRLDKLNFKSIPRPRWPKAAGTNDLAVLLYTSGTSGRPKGVMLSHRNITSAIAAAAEHAEMNQADVFLGVLPQFHCFGLIDLTLVPLTLGCKVVYTARFVPNRLLKLAEAHKPSVFIAIPAMHNALANAKHASPAPFENLRYCVSGGEPLPEAVADKYQEVFGVRIAEGFGMTETAAASHWCLPKDYKRHSVGKPLPTVQQRIVDPETGQDLPVDTDGELRLAGPTIMKGYYKLDDATRETFDERGYLRTGDMARIDADGHAYITGRYKDMMIVGGENVFPREIEEVLDQHPLVHASGVVGAPDGSRGEVPIAYVELAEDADPAEFDDKALVAHCRDRLAGYKVPRKVIRLDELPRNPTGKIMRRALRDRDDAKA